MQLSDFDFQLPETLIAQRPLSRRSDSRLLHVTENTYVDRQVLDLPGLLNTNDLLVVNDSKVIPARLFGTKSTGGKVEVLVERIIESHLALAMVRASKSPPIGSSLQLDGGADATVTGRRGHFFELHFSEPVLGILHTNGSIPLPPYIDRNAEATDSHRYQTVFANAPGSVAAPTAGLHFDDNLISALTANGIEIARLTLHVGAGTFSPVRVDDIRAHQMHSEVFEISPSTADQINATRARDGRIIAVGTTALRTLESAICEESATIKPGTGETDIFITPGYQFKAVDRLITNFHLPRSTLLMLVSAFAGMESIRTAYQHAVTDHYRFFSYGDAMFLDMAPPGKIA